MESADELDLGLDVSVDDLFQEIPLYPDNLYNSEYANEFEKLVNEIDSVVKMQGVFTGAPELESDIEQRFLEEISANHLPVITIEEVQDTPMVQIDEQDTPHVPPATENNPQVPPLNIQELPPAANHNVAAMEIVQLDPPDTPRVSNKSADDTPRVPRANVFDRLEHRPLRREQPRCLRNPYARVPTRPSHGRFLWDSTAKEFLYDQYYTVVQTFGQEIFVPKRCRNRYRLWKHKVPIGRIQLRWDMDMNLVQSRLTPSNGPY